MSLKWTVLPCFLSVLAYGVTADRPAVQAPTLLREGTGWAGGRARESGRPLIGSSTAGQVISQSNEVALQPDIGYRLEGWLRSRTGEGRLGADLVDDNGKVIKKVEAPPVRQVGSWRYVAVELTPEKAKGLRVWCWAKGQAEFDDVKVVPVGESFIANGGVEGAGQRGVPYWSAERSRALGAGRVAGTYRSDDKIKHSGKASVQLTAEGDAYAFSSLDYPMPAWSDPLQVSAWTRCEGSAEAQLGIAWIDDAKRVLRIDKGPTTHNSDWQKISASFSAPPPKTASMKAVAIARKGKVWFDDFDLVRLPSRKHVIEVYVNQVGYEQGGPKSAVVATNFFPKSTTLPCELIGQEGQSAWRGDAISAGRVHSGRFDDWGWYFWKLDFTPFQQPGKYRVRVKGEQATADSPAFVVEQGMLLKETGQYAIDFFYIQRCGCEVPGWHKACHLDDAKLPDGTHLDLTGGWHSAGDYNKLMYDHGDGGVVYAMMALYGSAPDQLDRMRRNGSGMPDILEEAKWGADFVAKMQIPGSNGLRADIKQGPGRNGWKKWSAPDVHTDNKIGTRDDPEVQPGEGNSPLVIGGWARLSVLLDRRGIKNDFLARAERLWDYYMKKPSSIGTPYLVLSALEMHRITGRPAYADFAGKSVAKILASQVNSGPQEGSFAGYGQAEAAALAQFALSIPQDSQAGAIKESLRKYIDFCTRDADNPFGLSRHKQGNGGLYVSDEIGHNFELLGRAWAAALAYRVTGDPRALAYAVDHVDFVLGRNPMGLCMFEGKGTLNPTRYHHRYNRIPGNPRGAVPGTVPNGFVAGKGFGDRVGFDMTTGGKNNPSFRTSEPWLVHNLFYLLVLSAVNDAFKAGPF